MNTTNFSMEFELNVSEIRKLNKMYFENLYKQRVLIFSTIVLFSLILFDFFEIDENNDVFQWVIKSLIIIVCFLLIQYSFVETIYNIISKVSQKLLRSDKFISKYKFNFTNSLICVHSPFGEIKHKWDKIEKAILTKDFFLLYIKERNAYIISISTKNNKERDIEKLLEFIENNVTHVIKT